MRKILLFFALVGAIASVTIGGVGGCGSSSASNRVGDSGDSGSGDTGTGAATGSKNWTEDGTALTIDNIVNEDGTGALVLPGSEKEVTTSASAPFYFGRFAYDDGISYYCGSISFKINKENDSSAYFSDVTLEEMSVVDESSLVSSTSTGFSNMDLGVDSSFNLATNHIEIANATTRFVGFDLYFGDDAPFPAITDAGVIFSSDFTTMAGGDDANFFFIAQKVASQPNASGNDIADVWSGRRFSVDSSTGEITFVSTFDVSINSMDSDSVNSFAGTDSELESFEGSVGLADASAGCFPYSFVDGTTIDGGFLLAADKSLAVGVHFDTHTYFAMQK